MAKTVVRTGEPVSLRTWGFFEKYEDLIEEMAKYAEDNHETINITFRGEGQPGRRQTWLQRGYNAEGDRELMDDITLFEDGGVSETQYEWVEEVEA